MGFLTLTTVFCLCLSATFATYGPDYGPKNHGGPRPQADTPKIKLEEPRIHLESPKIVLDKPSINLQGGGGHGPLLDEEPLFLENEKSLFYGRSFHGIPAALPAYASPLIVDSGYSTGKVLDISAPIQVINHAPIVHERPILIRRPVVVSKGLTATQDHLERLHYSHGGLAHSGLAHSGLVHSGLAHSGLAHSGLVHGGLVHGGLAHSGLVGHSVGAYSVPLSKGLHGGALVYGGGLGHGLGAYSAPLIIDQPKAVLGHADFGYSSGKVLGGAALHGPVLHGDGGALHGALHGGAPLKKY